MSSKLYFPTIHLFAYSYNPKSRKLEENDEDTNYNWLWEQCNQIIKAKFEYENFDFDLKSFLKVEDEKLVVENLINKKLLNQDNFGSIHISVDEGICNNNDNHYINDYFSLCLKQNNHIQAEIYSLKLYKSHALGLNIYPDIQLHEKEFSIEEIKGLNLNPKNCLVLPQKPKEFFLGQTILITAKLNVNVNEKNQENYLDWLKNNIADQYLEALFPKNNNFKKPVFNRAGKLLDKPIFEYGVIRQLDNYIHVLVWFIDINNKDERSILEKSYKKLLDLFFFRAKVISAYKETREHSETANTMNQEIEEEVEKMMNSSSKTKELDYPYFTDRNNNLVELNRMSLEYAKTLKKIEKHQHDIFDNTRNYTDKIREIQSIITDNNFDFLSLFGERTCHSFQEQTTIDLRYFHNGIQLVNNAINTLQSQLNSELYKVEEQREQQEKERIQQEKQRDQQEKQRDRNQNLLIFAAASALGAADLVNSNFRYIKQDNFIYNLPFINRKFIEKHPYSSAIIYSLFFSLLFSFLVGTTIWLTWTALKFFRDAFTAKKDSESEEDRRDKSEDDSD